MALSRSSTGSPLNLTVTQIKSTSGKATSSTLGEYATGDEFESIFSSKNKYYRFETEGKQRSVLSKDENIHTNDIYEISTNKILREFDNIPHLKLRPADFAYNRDVGVYPNNRLIILRRFANPINDDIYSITNDKSPGKPISTIVGYVKNTEDFINFNVNEEWDVADASFKKLLNKVGDDFGFSKFQIGDLLSSGNNIIPMPGATELLQRRLMVKFGLIGENESAVIPSGDPNLIKDAKIRKLVTDGTNGSGLTGKISIIFEVTYEQKFIAGVDPTFVYMDILGILLAMGTSESKFYLGGGGDTALNKKIKEFIHNPNETIKQFIKATIAAFGSAIDKLKNLFNDSIDEIADDGKPLSEIISDGATAAVNFLGRTISGDAEAAEAATAGVSQIQSVLNNVTKYIADFISAKYRVEALGIFAALSGAPSTPWHVTIGNPLRPTFCSGDMLCTKVDIKQGPQLSFNDLPTYITAKIELKSARDQGMQELFTKFNSGGMRTVSKTSDGVNKKGYLIQPGTTFWSKAYGLNVGEDGEISTLNADGSVGNVIVPVIPKTKVSDPEVLVDKIQPEASLPEQFTESVADATEYIKNGVESVLDKGKEVTGDAIDYGTEKFEEAKSWVGNWWNS